MTAGRLLFRGSVIVVATAAVVAVGVIISSAMPGDDPGRPEPPPELPVGAASHPWVVERHGVKASFDALASAHLKMLRIDALWARIERDQGLQRWEVLDDVVREANQRGVRLILTLHGTPAWANDARGLDVPPDNLGEFARFCRDVARRYQGHDIVYEVWNEQNAPFGWGGPVEVRRYASMLNTCSAAIREVDRSGTVIVGGLARSRKPGVMPGAAFVRALYAAGAGPAFDGIGFHPYAHGDATAKGSSLVADVPAIRKLMVENGDSAKQLWLTEFGYPVGPHHSPAQVAGFERKALVYVAHRYPYVAAVVLYELADEGANGFGLFHNDLNPRASARMLAKLLDARRGGLVRRP